MRKTLTALLFAAVLPSLSAVAHAMDDAGSHPMHGDGPRDGHMMRGFDLTPEQRQKVRSAMREQVETQREITKRYLDKLPAADKAAMQKEQDANREKQQKAVRDVLTPEQQKRYDEMQEELMKRHADREAFEAWKAERDKKAQ